MAKFADIETWADTMHTPEEGFTWFDYETFYTRDWWDLEYIDGRGCKNQQNALLDIIAKGIFQLVVEMHDLNRKLAQLPGLKSQEQAEQSKEPAAQIQVEQSQEAEDENQTKH